MKRVARFFLCAALLGALFGCTGRPSSTTKNDVAPVTAPEPPPPPTTPHLRKLVDTKKLFGTMPVANRFQDPLMTFTGSGWYGYANDGQSYGTILRVVAASPTNTAFLSMPSAQNPGGATVIGQLKTERTPLHIEVWLGRDGEKGRFNSVDVELAGLFTDGTDQAAALVPVDDAVVLDGRTWQRFTADVDAGPIGWAFLTVTDLAPAPETLLVGGAVAVDVPANANADLVGARLHDVTALQRTLIEKVRERTRNLAAPLPSLPAALPGTPPRLR